ncbi:MAG: phosphatidylserine decarboxylase [Verrucomicrobiae bacterium]|nr:phosphatidylserine decarboxylase [Verrucomicrobiae bacterium]
MAAPSPPVRFRNRYSGRIETEAIYGEGWLRWAYESPVGRLALRAFVIRPWFSRWYGWRMDRPASRSRIAPFLHRYALDPAEFADPPDSFRTFNEFFHRRLRPEARPVDPHPDAAVFPADGRHLGWSSLSAADRFYVKGQRFDLDSFLDDPALSRTFQGGPAVFSRLCPTDYHRFHFPVAGIPSSPRLLKGPLASVNPIALRQRLAWLWTNRRWQILLHTDAFGPVLVAPVGATNVGSAVFGYPPEIPAAKGAEIGCFRFGASAILTLFAPGRVRLAGDLLDATREGLELYAHVGDRLGLRIRGG